MSDPRPAGIAAAVLAAALGCSDPARVVIESPAGEVVVDVEVDIAASAEERERGLRGRSLGERHGLLIELPVAGEVCVVNTGVELDIDAVFIGGDARVSAVAREIPAGDGQSRCEVARWILEVRAGTAAAVMPGDVAELP